jgi:glycosyltransferase involved in cell wall biosynthesis
MKQLLILTSDFIPNIGGIAVDTLRLFNLLKRDFEIDLYAFGIKGCDSENIHYINAPKVLFPIYLNKIVNSKKYDAILVRTVLPLGWMLNKLHVKAKKVYFVYGQELVHDNTYKPLLRKSVKEIIKEADIIIAISNFTNSLIDNRGSVFYPLIEKSAESTAIKDKLFFNLLTAGRFVKHKNYISVLRMIKDIDAEVFQKTNKHVRLNIVGDGPLKREFENYIVENKISDIAKISGRVPISEMNKFYSESDIVIMPSIRTGESVEGFGMVAQESGLLGSITVGYDSGGIRESIIDSELLAKENDEDALRNIIIKLLTDKDFYEEKMRFSVSRAQKMLADEKRLSEFKGILNL